LLLAIAAAAGQRPVSDAVDPATPAAIAIPTHEDVWELQPSGVTASLRGIAAVDADTCWASGAAGTVIRTTNGGISWSVRPIDGAEKLDFRDIEAFSRDEAVVVSAGSPARVYQTNDGGESWQLVFEHPDRRAFFDAMAFTRDQQGEWTRRGYAFSDPIDGRLVLITTTDLGKTWQALAPQDCPPTLAGEAGFAASGTCLIADGQTIWIGLGGQTETNARLLRRDQSGEWTMQPTPIYSAESCGIFSLAISDEPAPKKRYLAVGGDYQKPDDDSSNIAISTDGQTWRSVNGQPPSGYRSAVAWFHHSNASGFIAVGPAGTDISLDRGENWRPISRQGFHALAFSPDYQACWAVGSQGRVARLILPAALQAPE